MELRFQNTENATEKKGENVVFKHYLPFLRCFQKSLHLLSQAPYLFQITQKKRCVLNIIKEINKPVLYNNLGCFTRIFVLKLEITC